MIYNEVKINKNLILTHTLKFMHKFRKSKKSFVNDFIESTVVFYGTIFLYQILCYTREYIVMHTCTHNN